MEIKRKLASIQKIIAIDSIPKADRIEKITVLGWECVAKKGEFALNDLCVYFEIDSVLPACPIFEFMEERKYRVKTAKFQKQIAQGLAMPLTILSNFTSKNISNFKEGDDVTELIGVIKYEPQEAGANQESQRLPQNPAIKYMMKYAWFRKCYFFIMPKKTKGNFPDFIIKTDEERIQSKPSILFNNIGKEFYITEKLDGSSATFFYNSYLDRKKWGIFQVDKGGGFGVCSRNLRLPTDNNSIWWNIANSLDIKVKLPAYCKKYKRNLAVQGEIIGPAIQKNKYKLQTIAFRVFSIFDIDTQTYVSGKEKTGMCEELGFVRVPDLGVFCIGELTTIKDLIDLSTRNSFINKDTIAEGIVCRRVDDDRISFKVINPKFLLKNDE